MIGGFQKYLVDNGFKRYTYDHLSRDRKFTLIENYESVMVSSYGPCYYVFIKDNIKFYWGLGKQGKSPYFYPTMGEQYEIIIGNYEETLNDILKGEPKLRELW